MQGLAVGVEREFQVSKTDHANLTNDNFQRLSYYLASIGACFPGVIDKSLTCYDQYYSFSQQTKEAIIIVAAILKPSLLEGKAIFLTTKPMMELIKPGFTNAHLTLTEKTDLTFLDIDRNGATGLNFSNTEVTRKMVYTNEWIDFYYYTPMANLHRALSGQVAVNTGYHRQGNQNLQCPWKESFISFILICMFSFLALCVIVPCYKKKFKEIWGVFFCCVLVPGLMVNTFTWNYFNNYYVVQ